MIPIRESVRYYLTDREWANVPEYLYHATLLKNLDSIAENGLGNIVQSSSYDDFYRKSKGFYVSFDYKDAAMYLSDNHDLEDIVVLQIPKSALDRDKLCLDYNNEDNIDYPTSWFYKGILKNPQEVCEIIES